MVKQIFSFFELVGWSVCTKCMLVFAFCVVVGCGKESNIASVSGTVTYDGAPLEGATVMFFPVKGRGSIGLTKADGTYVLGYSAGKNGAVIGDHKVTISIELPDDLNVERPQPLIRKLPAKYSVLEKSELKATVTKGNNQCDFSLSK